jgi:hypothetical protein
MPAQTGAPLIAGLGVQGVLLAVAMNQARGRGVWRALLLALAWIAAVGLALVIPDYRVLMAVSYALLFLIGAPFGWPPGNFFDVMTWPVINQLVCMAGGLVWAATAVVYQRRTRDACDGCGRTDAQAGWTTPAAAARWGKWAVCAAVVVPFLYAVTRWAWALGIPLGISADLLREGQEISLWWAGAGLATVAASGALLTLGLMQRWGEVFPRWFPFLAGKRVPPMLAIVPAALVAVIVTQAGLMFVRLTLLGTIGEVFTFIDAGDWAALGPELLWPLWGVALGAATLAYYYRRRGTCAHCGRG